jgi:alpha-tubulin suppressor-like RCC1 family protein
LAAGFEHSLAVCSQGNLYGWGDSSKGQLGLGPPPAEAPPPAAELPPPAETPPDDFDFIWAQSAVTHAAKAAGTLWKCVCFQTHHVSVTKCPACANIQPGNTYTESLAPTTDTTERRLRRVEKPQNLMKQFKLDPGEKIALVGAGEDFSIVVTTKQRCYTFGSGHVDEPEYLPTDIQLSNAFPGGPITEILGVDGGASHGCITVKVEPSESN